MDYEEEMRPRKKDKRVRIIVGNGYMCGIFYMSSLSYFAKSVSIHWLNLLFYFQKKKRKSKKISDDELSGDEDYQVGIEFH